TFSYRQKTGFRNLDDERIARAQEVQGIEHLEEEKAYRLPYDMRVQRISALFQGLAHLEGGAKQALHYTDVAPALVIMAVTKGGNHIFGHVIGATSRGLPVVKIDALCEALTVFRDDLLSPVYVGWVRGYLDEERAKFEQALQEGGSLAEFASQIKCAHPRQIFQILIADLQRPENASWLA
ncbi:MAG: type I-B CRISPR-associated protein Cas7/Cst2/DevR, partial [Nitrospinota bacterium]